MSKKKLNIEGISNELEGASLFFIQTSADTHLPIPAENAPNNSPESEPATQARQPFLQEKNRQPYWLTPKKQNIPMKARLNERDHETEHSSMHAIQHDMMIAGGSSHQPYDPVETIRKSVKQVGKEEFYLRLTPAEKSEVGKVVYTFNELYRGEGRKTSANDIGRIAIHQLLMDYKENGEKSTLSLVLAALNA